MSFFRPIMMAGGGAAYDADYQAILDRGTTLTYSLPTSPTQDLGNQFILDMKAAGLWVKSIAGKIYATDGDSDFATLDWVTPASQQATKVNSPTHSIDGFNGNGTTIYINSGTNTSATTQDNVTYASAAFINTARALDAIFGRADGSDFISFNTRNASNLFSYIVSAAAANVTNVANTDATVRFVVARSSGTQYHSFNGDAFTGSVKTFSTVTNGVIFNLAYSGSGTPTAYSNRGIMYFWIFNEKISDSEVAAFDTAVNNYLTGL